MREVIHKVFFAWNFKEEEKWLDKMSEHGLNLVNVGFCKYEFEEGVPGEYSYRMELMDHFPRSAEGIEYVRFVEETGAELVATYLRWAYFRKKTADGPFELFSDVDSRIRHINRLITLLLLVGGGNILIGMVNVSAYITRGFVGNGSIGTVNILLGLLVFFGIWKINKAKLNMKKERALHE